MSDEEQQTTLEERDEYRIRVCEAEAELARAYSLLGEAQAKLATIKAQVKQAEGMKEDCVHHLQNVIRGRGQQTLPFQGDDQPAG